MGPAYYVIAILGCGDASVDCIPVATVPVRYESQAACAAATNDALLARSDFDFPTLVAHCRPGAVPAAAAAEQPPTPATGTRQS